MLVTLVALQNEMARCGISTMLRGIPLVADVTACAELAAVPGELDRRPVDVLVVSLADDASLVALVAEEASRRQVKVLALADEAGTGRIGQLAAIPVDGVMLASDITLSTLEDTMRRLTRGELPLPSALTRWLLSQARGPAGGYASRMSALTPREHQVLELVAQGLSNKQIARRLALSEHGIKKHVANVLAKLNSPNRTLAVARALHDGLISSPA
jgi:two-component system nitrate/nitrite response regulator NarL